MKFRSREKEFAIKADINVNDKDGLVNMSILHNE